MISRADIRQAATDLGLAGLPLEVHSSLKSFGYVEGGPDAVIDGLLDAGCTVLVPTFSTWRYLHRQPLEQPELCFERNALAELDQRPYFEPSPVYDTSSTVINDSMGAIPAAMLHRPDHIRGTHPLNSFSAAGPLAEQLISLQTDSDVYAPLRALAERSGIVVMMGIGLHRMTLLHFAEQLAGRQLFRRWAADEQGNVRVVKIGSCGDGFERFAGVLAPIETRANIGTSEWRMFPAQQALDLGSAAIVANPSITRCANPECARCPDAIAGGPIVDDRHRSTSDSPT